VNTRTIAQAAAVGLTLGLALTGCGAADTVAREAVQQVNPWQDELRMYLDEEFADKTDAEIAEGCLGISMLGLDSPAQIGALVFAFDEKGELPDADVTLEEWAASEGDELPLTLPADLTVREVANEAGAYLLDLCGVDY
jgi:hypothetical protein